MGERSWIPSALPLLIPEHVPETSSWGDRGLLLAQEGIGPDAPLQNAERRLEIRQRAAAVLAEATSPVIVGPHNGFGEAAQAQDNFFGVRRVAGVGPEVFLAGFLTAHLDVVTDAELTGTSVPAGNWAALLAGVEAVQLGGAAVHPVAPWSPPDPGTARPAAGAAARRWQVGHRLFFTVTQGLLAALTRFTRAVSEDDRAEAGTALTTAAVLSRSGVALHFRLPADRIPAHGAAEHAATACAVGIQRDLRARSPGPGEPVPRAAARLHRPRSAVVPDREVPRGHG
jgi:hypothetical protein